MINIKKEFNNGLFDCLEIYSDTYKILEKTNNHLWNATYENPITIAKHRISDYIESNEVLEIEVEVPNNANNV